MWTNGKISHMRHMAILFAASAKSPGGKDMKVPEAVEYAYEVV